ncbi:MAG: hypothetical protein COW19_03800 [Zetaproteobacteria bacterium CG12_big_fil_rev_8_21_14_0_65_55_1124]|nr:MAG: hypothetical protein AUJ58_09210 [Zetaproteobacteria bacterium CG1_02_55_237]PIS18672.1 MAG: hypothetical protein COT53_09690 [Zetaproteobacteria bacterium CG08_land_8_20_14_0_20_55_17]PIW43276.1 MAG: hypothetical protein COW19_03800 [Zetaproteobacteria bacterium CG12_big_fil_rev_8_21_14_0_65_55_1124]PIY53407.1 MAG: hypothetical protein COZ01_04035 [Zetaproteobacteria bacterium CG_4_10_14_0_8_um_filter_55_43]PIZ38690.1 MAG: hypothetical protein COY36_05460 [Zetaproteobacteria bacterium 
MLLNGIMLVAVAGLWFMWWLNAKRQRLVESMLADSARQLHEATLHLQQAMELINKSTDRAKPQQHKTTANHAQKAPAAQEETQIAQMLNMQGEGKPVEDISRRLGLPLNQVKLMLKLHANRAS